jgi:hypothetical protein
MRHQWVVIGIVDTMLMHIADVETPDLMTIWMAATLSNTELGPVSCCEQLSVFCRVVTC